MLHVHQVEGANPSALTIFCPCGVVQTTCLPLMQGITGSRRAGRSGTPILPARGSRGIADPPDSESGSPALRDASRLAPTNSPSKHCQRCAPLVGEEARCNSG